MRAGVKQVAVPTMAAVFYIALIMPPEFSVFAGSLRLSPYRVVLLLVFIPLFMRLVQNTRQPIHAVDYLMMAHAAWVALALSVYDGVMTGIESGGIYAVESFGAYLLGRTVVTCAEEHRAVLKFMVAVLTGMLMLTLPESLTGAHIIREAARAILGGPGLPVIEPRMGLDRAFGSFDHPILYGVFAASTFAATYYVLNKERLHARALAIIGVVVVSTFLSLSTGPFVGLACQCAIIGWDRITKGINLRWSALMSGFMLAWFAVSMASNRGPILVFISYLTFSAESAYNRVLIWQFGTAEVARHPLFGIGFGDWIRPVWMSESMDNFWLVTTVRYGLPAFILLASAIIVLAIRQARMNSRDRDLNRHRMAWLAIMIGLSISGITVHFWNSLFAYFFFLMGTGAWLVHPQKRQDRSRLALLQGFTGTMPAAIPAR